MKNLKELEISLAKKHLFPNRAEQGHYFHLTIFGFEHFSIPDKLFAYNIIIPVMIPDMS